ncbi:hypothetical protein VCHA40P242_20252 [Vibrio chagasii]|nr:hypothetical protein VCHA36P164_10488 [Vibrio chagasii]CAH7139899.1 hypothetical protein VCHA40P242_20252 [Vibrio chagasii]
MKHENQTKSTRLHMRITKGTDQPIEKPCNMKGVVHKIEKDSDKTQR